MSKDEIIKMIENTLKEAMQEIAFTSICEKYPAAEEIINQIKDLDKKIGPLIAEHKALVEKLRNFCKHEECEKN